jgi:hypothetical protein
MSRHQVDLIVISEVPIMHLMIRNLMHSPKHQPSIYSILSVTLDVLEVVRYSRRWHTN